MSAPEVFRTPEDRFENLPGYDFRPIDADAYGLRMHYSDAGPRDGMPIVCFHGEPTWAYLYRKMIAPLVGGGHQAIVPDYAGFGRSDKPTDRGWCTYDRHVELVTAVRGGLGPRNAAVVVQVWGGPIGLRWAVEHVENVAAPAIILARVTRGTTGAPAVALIAGSLVAGDAALVKMLGLAEAPWRWSCRDLAIDMTHKTSLAIAARMIVTRSWRR